MPHACNHKVQFVLLSTHSIAALNLHPPSNTICKALPHSSPSPTHFFKPLLFFCKSLLRISPAPTHFFKPLLFFCESLPRIRPAPTHCPKHIHYFNQAKGCAPPRPAKASCPEALSPKTLTTCLMVMVLSVTAESILCLLGTCTHNPPSLTIASGGPPPSQVCGCGCGCGCRCEVMCYTCVLVGWSIVYMCSCTYACRLHVRIYMCVCTYAGRLHVRMYMCWWARSIVYMCVCTYACRLHVRVYMFVCTYACRLHVRVHYAWSRY